MYLSVLLSTLSTKLSISTSTTCSREMDLGTSTSTLIGCTHCT